MKAKPRGEENADDERRYSVFWVFAASVVVWVAILVAGYVVLRAFTS